MPARFRPSTLVLAVSAAFSLDAGAIDHVWLAGNYGPAVAPNPLEAPDTLTIDAGGTKNFSAVAFTNQSIVTWNADNLGFISSTVGNAGVWDSRADHALVYAGGSGSTFTNSGTFRKSAGTGSTVIASANVAFVNTGTGIVEAQTGTIAFAGSNATFQDGSRFQGAGVVDIASNAAFQGAIHSENLRLSAGSFGGEGTGGATLNGSTAWTGGAFTGTWSVAEGQALTVAAGGNKDFSSASFTHRGTLTWESSDRAGFASSTVDNTGLWDLRTNADFDYIGGSGSTFTNLGTLRKSGGAGVSQFNPNVGFVNEATGVIEVESGTLAFANSNSWFLAGTQFKGAGTAAITSNAAFVGSFASENLMLVAGSFNGTGAVLNGTVQWSGGSFSGSWQVAPGQTLNASGADNKNFSTTAFTNAGTLHWATEARAGFLSSSVVNEGLWDVQTDAGFSYAGGSGSTFTNRGTLRKSAGTGVSEFHPNVGFVNEAAGVIEVESGTLAFGNSDSHFQAGTQFKGTGTAAITSNAAFVGSFTSQNLLLAAGSFNGTGAVLNGTVQWSGGSFSGSWQVAPGQTLLASGADNKNFSSAAFTNRGTLLWTTNDRMGFLSSAVTNEGVWDVQTDADFSYAGGSGSTFTNDGVLRKSGAGITSFSSNVAFVNNGVVEIFDGTLQLPNNFGNPGVITGDGIVKTNALTNGGTLKPGQGVGTLTLEGKLVQTAAGIVEIELAGADLHDVLAVTGSAALGGTLAVRRAGGFMPAVGDSFIVVTFADRVGSSTFLPDLTVLGWGDGVAFDVVYGSGNVTLEVTAVPEPGSVALMAGGLAVLLWAARRRNTV